MSTPSPPTRGKSPHEKRDDAPDAHQTLVDHDLEKTAPGSGGLPGPATIVPAEGMVVGQYRLEGKLGQGGMGTVFRAFHTKLQKTVAIKFLAPQVASDPELVARFEREMRAVGALEHEHIVRAYDAGEMQGLHFLVMEFVNGADLAQLVRERGPFSVKRACEAIRHAALGLAHAHAHGLVHRDIKPSNLILATPARDGAGTDGAGRVKILDLGLARAVEAGPAAAQVTATGQILGTPDYMAPEQWGDGSSVDHRADLYALGGTLFFLLTGSPPFEPHRTVAAKMRAHLNEPAPSLAVALRTSGRGGTGEAIPDSVEAIYRRLMQKNPLDRFASAAALADALQAAIGGLTEEGTDGASEVVLTTVAALVPGSGDRRPSEPPPVSTSEFVSLAELGRESSARRVARAGFPARTAALAAAGIVAVIVLLALFGNRAGTPAARDSSEPDASPIRAADVASQSPDDPLEIEEGRAAPVPANAPSAPQKPIVSPPAIYREGKVLAPSLDDVVPRRVEMFENPGTDFPQVNKPRAAHRYEAGKYVIDVLARNTVSIHQNALVLDAESAIEFDVRFLSDAPCEWMFVLRTNRPLVFGLTNAGRVLITDESPGGPQYDCPNAALPKGAAAHKVLLVLRDGKLETYVDGVAVCEPVRLPQDLPAYATATRIVASRPMKFEITRFRVFDAATIPRPRLP